MAQHHLENKNGEKYKIVLVIHTILKLFDIVLWETIMELTKLILDDHGNNLDSFRISLESFRSFRGPLLLKPVTGQELYFAISYSKLALAAMLFALS